MSTENSVTENTDKQVEQLNAAIKHIINIFKDETVDITRALLNYKYILTHYKNKSIYDAQCRENIFNFLHPSCVALMCRNHDHFWQNNYRCLSYNMADEVANCCKLLIEIAVPLIKQQPKCASSIINNCLNSDHAFYKQFGHDWREARGTWLDKEEMKVHKEWRTESIKVGSDVDYLLNNRWHYGEIINITEKHSDEYNNYKLFHIQPKMTGMYPDDGSFSHEWMLMESTRCQITTPLTKSIQHLPHMTQWRKQLNTTDNNRCAVKCLIGWRQGIITKIDVAGNRIRVKFHDSNIDDDDDNEDDHSQWVFRDSQFLQPFDTNEKINKIVEDDNDPDNENIFTLNRGKLTRESFHLVGVLNQFGICGGFDAILKLLSDPCFAVLSLQMIIPVFTSCFTIYSKSFSETFLPKMYELLIKILESLNVNIMNKLHAETFDKIINYIGDLMCRYHSNEIIRQIKEKWTLELTLRGLYCRHSGVCNKIEELFQLSSGFSNIKNPHVTVPKLINWTKNNNILRCLLGLRNVILCKSDVLIAGYTRQYFGDNQYLSLDVLNLMQMWFDDYSNPEFMWNCTSVLIFMHKHGELEEMDINMLFNAIMSLQLNNQNLRPLTSIIVNTYIILGEQIMLKCVNNFRQHKYVIQTMRVMLNILFAYVDNNSIIRDLIENKQLLDCLFDDIKYLKKYVRNCIDKNEDESSINNKKLFITKHSYIEHVVERIEFFEYIAATCSDIKFELEECHKDELYLQFIENALTRKEREIAITKLNKIIGCEDKYPLLS